MGWGLRGAVDLVVVVVGEGPLCGLLVLLN
jgi:hypothetical protein